MPKSKENYWHNKTVLVTGGAGFLGRQVVGLIEKKNPKKIVVPRSSKDDLRDLDTVKRVVKNVDLVIHLAAKVGGIGFNQQNPGELFYENLIMGVHLMEEARRAGVEKFVGLGTVCQYP